jgi:AraC family transcriptional regulator, regulatory protein of adaptative response / methylated-DNA-[protein]-cysteine methyltransferase
MTDYERIEKVIRYLKEHYVEQPDLRTLAGIAQVSEFHFHRLFSRWAGVTPKALVKFLTAKHAKALLRESQSVLDASLDSGLSGSGRLHDLLVSVDAVSPGEFKNYGEGMEIRYGFHSTPFGSCLIGATARGICHLSFLDRDSTSRRASVLRELKSDWPKAVLRHHPQSTREPAARIFNRGITTRSEKIPVFLVGTPFRLKVWEALLKIPSGSVLSYHDVARSIGAPNACRAVGSAVGANPVAYLIPCHRVIRETGIVGDYRWGQARKLAMLAWENGSSHADGTMRSPFD